MTEDETLIRARAAVIEANPHRDTGKLSLVRNGGADYLPEVQSALAALRALDKPLADVAPWTAPPPATEPLAYTVGDLVPLHECPPGLFLRREQLCFKPEGAGSGLIDAFVVATGISLFLEIDERDPHYVERYRNQTVRPVTRAAKAPEEAADADGWIAWTGGDCPVPDDTQVEVRSRDGILWGHSRAGGYWWHHDDVESDIIAYRLVNQEASR